MTQFKDRPWSQRFDALGDRAEGQFERVTCDTWIRWGLQRPPLKVSQLPARIRYAPDYLTSRAFVEAQGFGRDGELKVKIDKYNALHWWNDVHPVHLFVYDSHKKRNTRIALRELDRIIADGGARLASFPEGKSYFAIDGESVFDAAAT